MPPTGDFQPLPQERNGHHLARLSRIDHQTGHQHTGGFLSPDKDKLDVGHLFAVVRRRAIIIAGVAFAVSSGIVAHSWSQAPKYQGKFQLLIGPVTSEDKLDQLNQTLGKTASVTPVSPDYNTQIKVLWSP